MAADAAAAALHLQRWAACAVALDRLPPVGTEVYYFPQGHAEQWPFIAAPHAPNPKVACTIESIELFTTGELPFARISLRPGNHTDNPATDTRPDPDSFIYFAKQLSESDLRKSYMVVPLRCAEAMFPALHWVQDRKNTPQPLGIPDLDGKIYNFQHTADARRRHHLGGDWQLFHEEKELHEDDTVVFIRGIQHDVFIESFHQHPVVHPDLQEPLQELTASSALAAQGDAFTVTFYPGMGTGSPFVVPRGVVDEWTAIQWVPGMQVRVRARDLVQDAGEVRGALQVITGTITEVNPGLVWRTLEINVDAPPEITNKNVWEVEPIQDPPPRTSSPPPPPPAKKAKVSTELQLGPSSSVM